MTDDLTEERAEARLERARQRLIRKNWKFSALPKAILVGLLVILTWEVLRQNMDVSQSPWCFAILGVGPAATLSGVFASLILAREQYARSMRPSLAWSSQLRPSDGLGAQAWTAHLMNFGPGIAHVEHVLYTVKLSNAAAAIAKERIGRHEVINILMTMGLHEGRDYQFKLVTPGAPLPVAKTVADGIEIAAFGLKTIPFLKIFDVHVAVIDTMGDIYEKSLPFTATLPRSMQ